MTTIIVRRFLILIPMMFVLSVISFVIIQLPPGDFLTKYVQEMEASGMQVDQAVIDSFSRLYGLDRPVYVQYFVWMKNFIMHGQLGRSMLWDKPVTDILIERVPMTMMISVLSLIVVWIVAIPIGIYSATHTYSLQDYFFTFLGFIGLALPNFLFAVVLLWLVYSRTGYAITGLFSYEYLEVGWSWARFVDMLKHIWLPLVVLATAGTAGLIRVMRGNLIDELNQKYVVTARAKGVPETRLLWKYPIRVAFNPIVSTIGWMLPALVSGEVIVSIVLNIPTMGPIILNAVMGQDMYLAGSSIMILSALSVFGTLISDLALLWLDPRIRYD